MEPNKKFRRLSDSLKAGELITPHLEKALITKGSQAFGEEYAIKIYNKERHFDGYFHPSSHCTAPDLRLYYEFHPDFKVPKEDYTVDTYMNFQVGSALHSMIQSLLIECEFTTEDEVEVQFKNEKRKCTGTVDVRKVFLPNGEVVPLEFKTASYMPKEPPESYIKQFQVYMDVGCEEPQEKGILLYMSKVSPHNFKEFVIYRDEKVLDEVYSKWSRVLEAIKFNDALMLDFPCHEFDSKSHKECPARYVCRLGHPTGDRPPILKRS